MPPDCCRPFDQARNGLILGEGAAALLLMNSSRARREGFRPLARIRGWGAANDAVHLTAPARDGRGLIKACRRALRRAELDPEDLAAINAHGTGTIHNDDMELHAFGEIFRRRRPCHSVKGALGHTLGAAGALETVIALDCLRHGLLPPTTGLEKCAPRAAVRLSSAPQEFSGPRLLLCNSGFGGVNAALILEKVEERRWSCQP